MNYSIKFDFSRKTVYHHRSYSVKMNEEQHETNNDSLKSTPHDLTIRNGCNISRLSVSYVEKNV